MFKSRTPFTVEKPYRNYRPETSKIIFLSCEGSVTEEEYFKTISDIYSGIKSRIQLISVAEDAVETSPKCRTKEQRTLLSKVRPKQLVERIDNFKKEKEGIYQFSQYPEDEFWIITDVDKNWSDEIIDRENNKTYKDEWDDAVRLCDEKKYCYAVSNPFFELWLLLHHTEPSDEDRKYAVSDNHCYEGTNHFNERLRKLNVPINKKHIKSAHYNSTNVQEAITRARDLHKDKDDLEPRYLATTVYLLLEKIIEMVPESSSSGVAVS